MTGRRDYLLRVATSGLSEFERFLVGTFTKIPGVAARNQFAILYPERFNK